ncbi:hypothetical protein A8B75_00720 [Sphingomonadales bacterium EhC05]|nr:hypothetical protein A8B75_00720 [Sphingomonadales bacterium EhC05]
MTDTPAKRRHPISCLPAVTQAPARKVTVEPVFQLILQHRHRPVRRGGTYVGTIKKPDNAGILRGLAQLDRADRAGRDGGVPPEGHGKEKEPFV